jgi:hypothetical protein
MVENFCCLVFNIENLLKSTTLYFTRRLNFRLLLLPIYRFFETLYVKFKFIFNNICMSIVEGTCTCLLFSVHGGTFECFDGARTISVNSSHFCGQNISH